MLGSFYPGFMYGGASGWLGLVEMLDVNGMTASVAFVSPALSKTTALSNNSLSVATAIGSIALTGGRSLSVANHTIITSMSTPVLAVVRNMVTGNLNLLVTASQANLDRLTGVHPDNLSLITTISSPSLVRETLISSDNVLVALSNEGLDISALRSMGVEPISVISSLSSTLAQIGYPVFDIGSDNIYALGTIEVGDYGVVTINNNEVYKVVEQDGI